ncbi:MULTISPECIES: ParA family protein [unclassified Halomonas]|uniref:ParA family protein n=1 Tax=unclassified Halomonas TaxID=2609666 RepID=UPI002883D5D0|nr:MULTISPECIES: ParA family protein [unclassified Halomonas]MDT0501926.1 ParA family protein [Halomonas sp. PAR7]MDT0510985.1 ParA family protein [Halomonas sp. LES1]MDT0592498.1 ParA family protein [Halomonas sp. PAR8]
MNRYAVWNNKGGVGKSTITFHLATRYAEENPDKRVLVVDLCPQSNSSMMLLGGGVQGEGHVLDFCSQGTPRTVVGYLSEVLAGGMGAPLPDYRDYMVNVSDYNENLDENLYLMCGDGNLEPMAPAISGAASAPKLTLTGMDPWEWVHLVFKKLIENVTDGDEEWMVFIDTNPSFSIFTELAISAANRLITPVNADDSSRVAANAMFILLHGQYPPHPIYGSWTFANRAHERNMEVPKIHVIVGNRLTQYVGAASAFEALSDATATALYTAYQHHPQYFTAREDEVESVGDFKEKYSVPLRDFNTAGVVSAHLGMKVSSLRQGYYPMYGHDIKVNRDRIDECVEALDEVVQSIS